MTVWKFVVAMPDSAGASETMLPVHARPISVGIQGGSLVVWAVVDGDIAGQIGRPRALLVVNTGTNFDLADDAVFLGTVTSDNGIVWHVWDGGWA